MAEKVEAAGIDIFAGLAGFKLLVENGRVAGVQTVDMGLDKEGHPKPNFEPGSLIKAKVTVLCEGVHGSLTKQAFERIPELRAECLPQSYLTGVKEVWEIPAGRMVAGEVIHTIGWPSEPHEYGGGWIYAMSDTMVSVGYAVGLDSPNPTNDPHIKFQRYKTHPLVRRILDGGTMLHYGAKTIPEGGYYSVPKLYHDGLLLCGDSAGLLNPQRLKGIHLAIKSGHDGGGDDFRGGQGGAISAATAQSVYSRPVRARAGPKKNCTASRNFHAGFEGGLCAGMFHAGMQIATGGRGLFDRRDAQARS